jgi:hypothetical protein
MSDRKNIVKKRKEKSLKKDSGTEGKLGKATKGILGGEMLSIGTFRFFPFLVYIAFLAFIYIANNYYAEAKIRDINHLRKELKEINYEYITSKSKVEELSKQSQLAKRLEEKGIKESTQPVKTIRVPKDQN